MRFVRLFTQSSCDAYDLIHFKQPEAIGDGFDVPLEHPENWSHAAVELLADEAASCALSPDLKLVEENTVPSWLWRHSGAKAAGHKETSVRSIFDRVVGAATYQGWKQKLFTNEDSARAFFDEARYALAQRFIAFEPKKLALLGLKWAYGIEIHSSDERKNATPAIDISNAMIDTIVSGKRDRGIVTKWNKIIHASAKASSMELRFADTEAQWEAPTTTHSGATLNLMGFRHNDGSVNIDALRHATRIAVLLHDLQDESVGSALAIGYANLAPLLLALALPYDSEAARATAAAISAIVTAECYTVSAELAALRGVSPEFVANREASLRALRNHRRAAYGEQNDYEKISVTPAPLALAACPDLALTAAARSGWDQALEAAQMHGLRHTQVTSLFASPALTLFMESDADGIAPMRTLITVDRTLNSSVNEALTRLGYDQKKIQGLTRYALGTGSLDKAPAINHATLRKHGFTTAVLDNLEAYLPQAKNLRHAFTPWVLGVEFCRKTLKIPAAKIDDLRFNLLAHLGFSEKDIAAANAWCYGHETLAGAEALQPQHATVFATSASLSPEAQIRMAAAVQGFVSGETNLKLALPVGMATERFEKLLLDAWRRGVKSAEITFDANLRAEKRATSGQSIQRKTPRKIAPSAFLHTHAPGLPKRQSRSGTPRLSGLSQGKAKSRGVAKGH